MNPIKSLDAGAQKGVNAISVWLTRHGWPKSIQMHTCAMVFLCHFFFAMGMLALAWWPLMFLLVAPLSMMGDAQEFYRADVRAERLGKLSTRDGVDGRVHFLKVMGVVMIGFNVAIGLDREHVFYMIGWTSYVLRAYLYGAPRFPPPKQQEAPADLKLVLGGA